VFHTLCSSFLYLNIIIVCNSIQLLLLLLLFAHLFLIQLVCAYPPGLSETTLLLLCIVISRSVPQQDVFLLPMQSVGASTSLTKIVFGLLMSVSYLNKNNCSLFLYHLSFLIVFYCVSFFLFSCITFSILIVFYCVSFCF
jgi:hypothetical protein